MRFKGTDLAAGVCFVGAVATTVGIVRQHASDSPSTALYTGAGDGSINSCVARDYTTARAVDIAWQVTNHDSRPHDYKIFVDAAPRFEKEVDFSALAPGYQKAGSVTIAVTPASDGSWPLINCTVTAVAS